MKNFFRVLFYKDEDPDAKPYVVFVTFSGTNKLQEFRNVIHIDLGQTWVTLTFDDYSTLSYPSNSLECVGSEVQED